ncbi:SPFH domain-containing protein [Marinobacter sp. ELB17]|uniref:SPFH domain-containing protein n=1 Tax=Marinobacter sp. ELB17 TaxID=270374 RepID=UPI0000F39C69|nr:SPFH domain-containing protein [Marinobacter sp. ELB17]EAZ97244.1 membrane protease protein family [Marinobacter sp. ELB17]
MSAYETFFAIIAGIIAMGIALPMLISTLVLVEPRQARMIYSWAGGEVLRTITEPGLYFKLPFPLQSTSDRVSLAERIIKVTNRARSKEEAFFDLEVKAVMQIRSSSVMEATFNLENPEDQIKASISEAVKAIVPTLELSEVYSDREKISKAVMETLNKIYDIHGWECLRVIVEDPKLDASIEEASNKRIENRRRAEAAEDFKRAIFLEQTGEAEADAKSLTLRAAAAGEAKNLFTQEMVKSIKAFRDAFPDLDPSMLLHAMDGLDRRDSIISASKNPGSVIVVDTASDKGQQYASMAAYGSSINGTSLSKPSVETTE